MNLIRLRRVSTLVLFASVCSAHVQAQTWQPRMPNRVDVVAQVAAAHPAEFKAAGTGGEASEAFIRLLACELHRIDAAFGLNGKRGTSQVSDDAIAYVNPTVVWTNCPTCGPGAEAADVINSAGGPTPQPAWLNITDPAGSGSRWIAPTNCDAALPPQPPSTDFPAVLAALAQIQARLDDFVPQLDQARAESLNAAIRALENQAKLDALLARPLPSCPVVEFPNYQGTVWGFKVVLRPVR